MGASKEWTEWHLTPRGWVRGKQVVDFAGHQDDPEPEDSVAVWEHRETQSSIYSKMEVATRLVRETGDPTVIKELLAKFGPCPKNL